MSRPGRSREPSGVRASLAASAPAVLRVGSGNAILLEGHASVPGSEIASIQVRVGRNEAPAFIHGVPAPGALHRHRVVEGRRAHRRRPPPRERGRRAPPPAGRRPRGRARGRLDPPGPSRPNRTRGGRTSPVAAGWSRSASPPTTRRRSCFDGRSTRSGNRATRTGSAWSATTAQLLTSSASWSGCWRAMSASASWWPTTAPASISTSSVRSGRYPARRSTLPSPTRTIAGTRTSSRR